MNVTERKVFTLDKDTIVVEIQDTKDNFCWRMMVNGETSGITSYFQGILAHRNYGLATDYWNGVFKEFVPFKIVHANETK